MCEIVHLTIFLSNKAFKFEQRKHLWKCSSVALWTRMTVERWYSITWLAAPPYTGQVFVLDTGEGQLVYLTGTR